MLTEEMRLHMLTVPVERPDVVLDTDTFNEVDDQYALAYLIHASERVNLRAVYAAPFYSQPFFSTPIIYWRSDSPEDGMERSYDEIHRIISMCNKPFCGAVLRGAKNFLTDNRTPSVSPAAMDLAERAMRYTPENPLYVVAIATVTNVASALLLNPEIADRMVVCSLIGNAHTCKETDEFNLMQDVSAAQVLFHSGVPLVQLPCEGVVEHFTITIPELAQNLEGKGPLCDYLFRTTRDLIQWFHPNGGGSHPIWDVCAAAWPMNRNDCFMESRLCRTPGISNTRTYFERKEAPLMRYVTRINREMLYRDLFQTLIE